MKILSGETTLDSKISFTSENFTVIGKYYDGIIYTEFFHNKTSNSNTYYNLALSFFKEKIMPISYNDDRILSINIVSICFLLLYIVDKIYIHKNLGSYFYILYYFFASMYYRCNLPVRKMHGAEHKVAISYIQSGYLKDIEFIRKTKRTSIKCGTTTQIFQIIFFSILMYIIEDTLLTLLLSNIITYIVYKLIVNKENRQNNIIFLPFLKTNEYFQEIFFTAEPDDKDLDLAVKVVQELETLENALQIQLD